MNRKEPKHQGKKMGRLTILGWSKIREKDGKRKVVCRCECGNLCEIRQSSVTRGDTTSCGCAYKDMGVKRRKLKAGDKIGKLVVLGTSDIKKNDHLCYNVLCECGKTNIVTGSDLMKKNGNHTKTCGNCHLQRNGRFTSQLALDLHDIIGYGEHNYYTDTRYGVKNHRINVDIALVEEKIVVEFDGSYWHKNTKQKDLEQTNLLVEDGWRVLRIKSRRQLPDKSTIDKALDRLRKDLATVIIIDMESK